MFLVLNNELLDEIHFYIMFVVYANVQHLFHNIKYLL